MQLNLSPRENLEATKQDMTHEKWHRPPVFILPKVYKNACTPLENNPEIPPSSRDEGLRLLHGLETNLATSRSSCASINTVL